MVNVEILCGKIPTTYFISNSRDDIMVEKENEYSHPFVTNS